MYVSWLVGWYHDGHEVVHEDDAVLERVRQSRFGRLQPIRSQVHLPRTVPFQYSLQHLAVGSHV